MLEVVQLGKRFKVGSAFARGGRREVQAVDEVSFKVLPGETLGLVGESGCGKSTLARCIVRLHDCTSGALRFEGRDITHLGARAMRPIRPRLQMVFQDPYTSLNPRRRVGDLIAEPLRVHGRRSRAEVAERVRELAALVGLLPEQLSRFPHEFSGGQRQRIGIARALALEPRLIVADEPVSALDVSIQAQIVNLLAELQERLGLTYLFIAHDLSVVRQVSTRTAVMYLGSIVEIGATDTLYEQPAHPYTAALISAVPVPSVAASARRHKIVLAGDPPSPLDPPSGCRFHPRCAVATQVCRSVRPPLLGLADGRAVACHHPLV
ncbi:MAG: ATP-binding cassette domain-containing protein [Burkholderiales bacterium]|nr:ATP-binding cassette domain-containing protein [Burkholderiales bacterium]